MKNILHTIIAKLLPAAARALRLRPMRLLALALLLVGTVRTAAETSALPLPTHFPAQFRAGSPGVSPVSKCNQQNLARVLLRARPPTTRPAFQTPTPPPPSRTWPQTARRAQRDALSAVTTAQPQPQPPNNMGKNSSIEWTGPTFNPWWGCVKISPACKNCYAAKLAHRRGSDVWGPNSERRFFGDTHWAEPLKWNREAEASGVRTPVFCASMADVFEDRSDLVVHRERLWRLIADTPWLNWQLLTKRPENILNMVPWGDVWPDNVWIGATVENQEFAETRIPHIVKCPARVRFLSCEPLLGPLDLSRWSKTGEPSPIHWIIAGGESGGIEKSRPTHPDWFRSLRDFCSLNDIAYFFKQWGNWIPAEPALEKKGRPETQLSEPSPVRMLGLSKLSTGRILDGKTHDEFPADAVTGLLVQAVPALNADDRAYLASRESVVREGLTGTIVAAIALREIRTYLDGKLWRSSHGSFAGYIRDRWAYAKAHVYRLLASGNLIHEIETKANAEKSPCGDWLPSCESHLRPLKDIPEAKRAECWMTIVAKTPPAELTQNYVKAETAKFAETIGVAISKPKAKSPPAKVTASAFLEKLRAVVQEMPTASEINAILAQVDPYLV